MTKRKASQSRGSQPQGSQEGMSGTERDSAISYDPSAQEPADILREILSDPTVTIPEKINAAKALDAIQKRGAEARDGRASRMSRADLVGEIARVRSLLAGQSIEKAGKAAP
jgi:hypothetical protein